MGNTASRDGRKLYIPPGSERPLPPGRPEFVPWTPDVMGISEQRPPDSLTLRWDPPVSDGGAQIIGYLVERRETGSNYWMRVHASLVRGFEVTLTGLEPGRRFQFRVSAENGVGISPPSEPSDLVSVYQKPTATAPNFIRELTDIAVMENERVEFLVQVLGSPTPTITWYKDGFEIFPNKRTRIANDGDRSMLIFAQVSVTDNGEVKCTATNKAGHASTKARLLVEAPPRIHLPKAYEEGLLFANEEVVRLKVPISGNPAPTVTWFHDMDELETDSRHEIINTDKATQLRILAASRNDRGEYTVKLESELGEDATSFLVTITDRPQPPGKVRVCSIQESGVTIEWDPPEDDGGCKIGNFIIEYYKVGWNVWLKALTTRQVKTELTNVIAGSEYMFRAKAENPYGVSEPGEESDSVFIPDPKRGIIDKSFAKDTVDLLGPLHIPNDYEDMGDEGMEEGEEGEEERGYEDEEDERRLQGEDLQHGDSELMLVLLPDRRKGKEEKDPETTSEYASNGAGPMPPPLSFSAPEIGSDDIYDFPPLRNSVSSSELLRERAMARIYREEEERKARTGRSNSRSAPPPAKPPRGGLEKEDIIDEQKEFVEKEEDEEEYEKEFEEEEEEYDEEEEEELVFKFTPKQTFTEEEMVIRRQPLIIPQTDKPQIRKQINVNENNILEKQRQITRNNADKHVMESPYTNYEPVKQEPVRPQRAQARKIEQTTERQQPIDNQINVTQQKPRIFRDEPLIARQKPQDIRRFDNEEEEMEWEDQMATRQKPLTMVMDNQMASRQQPLKMSFDDQMVSRQKPLAVSFDDQMATRQKPLSMSFDDQMATRQQPLTMPMDDRFTRKQLSAHISKEDHISVRQQPLQLLKDKDMTVKHPSQITREDNSLRKQVPVRESESEWNNTWQQPTPTRRKSQETPPSTDVTAIAVLERYSDIYESTGKKVHQPTPARELVDKFFTTRQHFDEKEWSSRFNRVPSQEKEEELPPPEEVKQPELKVLDPKEEAKLKKKEEEEKRKAEEVAKAELANRKSCGQILKESFIITINFIILCGALYTFTFDYRLGFLILSLLCYYHFSKYIQ